MTMFFENTKVPADIDQGTNFLNITNTNAADLFRWLGVREVDVEKGQLPARELAALCRRRLWGEPRNNDPALPATTEKREGYATLIFCGRPAGYLKEKTLALLRLCELDINGDVTWY